MRCQFHREQITGALQTDINLTLLIATSVIESLTLTIQMTYNLEEKEETSLISFDVKIKMIHGKKEFSMEFIEFTL